MYRRITLLSAGLVLASASWAEVKELEGEELVGAFVQGISIGQPVVGESFDEDDQKLRDATIDQRNALGPVEPELAVSNLQALQQPRTAPVDQMVADIQEQETRDLVEDTIMQTSLSTRMDVNLDRIGAETGISVPKAEDTRNFDVLRGSILELLPSATGYQLEFLKNR